MVCTDISNLECAFLLGSQQDIKLFFIIFYYIIFIFFWYFFTEKRIDKLKYQYFVWPVMLTKWVGVLYLVFTPVHFILYQSTLDYNLVMGWFALFYVPIMTLIMLMPFLMMFDWFFKYMGYESAFEFVKKYKKRLIQ